MENVPFKDGTFVQRINCIQSGYPDILNDSMNSLSVHLYIQDTRHDGGKSIYIERFLINEAIQVISVKGKKMTIDTESIDRYFNPI